MNSLQTFPSKDFGSVCKLIASRLLSTEGR